MTFRARRLAPFASLALVAVLCAPAIAQSSGAGERRLDNAYKREFAFLEAEKRSLQKRLASEKASAAARIEQARDDIAALQAQVVRVAGEAERLEETMLAAERDIDALDQSEDVAEDILTRADAALDKIGVAMPEADLSKRAQVIGQLEFAFSSAPTALAAQGTVRIETGAYYDADGVKVEGKVLRIGDVASYGLVDGAMGPLAPAGEGRLKLWPTDGGSRAAGLFRDGKRPKSLPMFLYESLDKGVSRKADNSVREIIETGGIIAWVIVGLGLVALLMIVARGAMLAWASRGTRKLLAPTVDFLERGETDQAIELCSAANNPSGRVLTATLQNLDRPRDQLEDVVAEAVLQEQPVLSRFGSSILVLAAVSPLMGLLGTVTGMISTFEIITEFGTGNPKLLSGGISEALVTTELGLIVAIPALLCGHILTGWSDRIRDTLDAAALSAVNRAAGLAPPDDDDVAAAPAPDANDDDESREIAA